jgi:Zn-dependent protease/predicted transcriptional regulator
MQGRSRIGWQIGKVFDIPLIIDSSWLVILGLLTFANGLEWQQLYPTWPGWQAWTSGFVMALCLFLSVLIHELGHSLVAKSHGTKVNSITLFLFGGIASLDEESRTPGKAFQVAIAGPVVSLLLWIMLYFGTQQLPMHSPAQVIGSNLADMNLVLALFNLIPGLPLDGGQVLKAAVWKATGNRFTGVHWAARVGQVLGWIAIFLGLLSAILAGNTSGFWIALLGWFGIRNAFTYDRFTDLQETLIQLQAKDGLTRDFRVINAEQSIRAFADDYVLSQKHPAAIFAASDGRYRGLVDVNDLGMIERSEWETRSVRDLAKPLTAIPTVREQTSLPEVIEKLESEELPFLTVLSPADTVAGIIDRGDVMRVIGEKMRWMIPPEEIRRIKEEGTFPATFQIQAIARAVLPDLEAKAGRAS